MGAGSMERTQRDNLPLPFLKGEPGIAGFKGEQGPKGEPVSICPPALGPKAIAPPTALLLHSPVP